MDKKEKVLSQTLQSPESVQGDSKVKKDLKKEPELDPNKDKPETETTQPLKTTPPGAEKPSGTEKPSESGQGEGKVKKDKPVETEKPTDTKKTSAEPIIMERKDIKAKAVTIVKKVRDEVFFLATCREARVCINCGADVGGYEKVVDAGKYSKHYEQVCKNCGYKDEFKIVTIEPQKSWYENI